MSVQKPKLKMGRMPSSLRRCVLVVIAAFTVSLSITAYMLHSLTPLEIDASLNRDFLKQNITAATFSRVEVDLEIDEGLLMALRSYFEMRWNETQGTALVRTSRLRRTDEKEILWPVLARLRTSGPLVHPSVLQPSTAMAVVPRQACSLSTYSIIVVAGQESVDLRLLVINCIKWMVDPALDRIWILLPMAFDLQMSTDGDYGQRLLRWSKNDQSPVNVIADKSLWSALAQVTAQTERKRKLGRIAECILWVKGSMIWRRSTREIRSGFRQWKEHSRNLIVSAIHIEESKDESHQTTSPSKIYLSKRELSHKDLGFGDFFVSSAYLRVLQYDFISTLRDASASNWEVSSSLVETSLFYAASAVVGAHTNPLYPWENAQPRRSKPRAYPGGLEDLVGFYGPAPVLPFNSSLRGKSSNMPRTHDTDFVCT